MKLTDEQKEDFVKIINEETDPEVKKLLSLTLANCLLDEAKRTSQNNDSTTKE